MSYLKVNKQNLDDLVDESFVKIGSTSMEGAILTQYSNNNNKTILVVDSFGEEVFIIN